MSEMLGLLLYLVLGVGAEISKADDLVPDTS